MIIFYTLAALLILSSLMVVFQRNVVHCAMALVAALFVIAILFVTLQAPMVGVLQILVYAGAIMVLFLFVIMLLNLAPEKLARSRIFTLRTLGACTALLLFVLFVKVLAAPTEGMMLAPHALPNGNIESIGKLLFEEYLLPFELTSFLILAAIIGAVTLAKQQPRK